jgi:uncharacterized protein
MANDNTSQRGLASADEDTKQRVAQAGGQAVSQDNQQMSDIGKKGGQSSQGGGTSGQTTDDAGGQGGGGGQSGQTGGSR